MLLLGLEHVEKLTQGEIFSAKAVFNASGAIFFPATRQHRDMKAEDISYEDNYAGNAMAAMLAPGRFEIRFHKAYPDRRVCEILQKLTAAPELAALKAWNFTYQGRPLKI